MCCAGILMCHLGQHQEARVALESYSAWLEGNTQAAMPSDVVLPKDALETGPPVDAEEVEIVKRLLLKLTQLSLETVFTRS